MARHSAKPSRRWLPGKSSMTRSKTDTRTPNDLTRGNGRIQRAWVLKDELGPFWSCQCAGSAQTFFKRWTTAALRSRLPSPRIFANTLRQHPEHPDVHRALSSPTRWPRASTARSRWPRIGRQVTKASSHSPISSACLLATRTLLGIFLPLYGHSNRLATHHAGRGFKSVLGESKAPNYKEPHPSAPARLDAPALHPLPDAQ
jgi:hypothetical protein